MSCALLVEFEGVLVETRAARRAALVRALLDDGVVLTDDEYDAHCAGLDVPSAVRAAALVGGRTLDETALDLAALRAERGFAERIGKGVSLAPGARAFLDETAGRARLALVTRASRREVEFVLALAGLDALFECVVAAGDSMAKPSPAPYLRALERLSRRRPVRAEDALALEDALPGARAARAAGLRCVVVGEASTTAGALPSADGVITSLEGETLASLDALVSSAPRLAARGT